jgi:hypothetical protein
MAKGKNRPPRGPQIKNGNLIGKGEKLPVIKDEKGNREWVKSHDAGKAQAAAKQTAPSPQVKVKESKLQQAAKTHAVKLPPKPAVEKKPPTVKPPSK